jgi:murein L,D-transpeptidase YafK
MKRLRSYLLIVIVAAGSAMALIAGADFFKLQRNVPALALADERADRILIEKSERRLTLFRDGKVLKTYRSALGRTPVGHKQQEGDGRTPEGNYFIDFKNRRSGYHLALRISYPDAQDRISAQTRNVPAGGDIMIHGLRNGLGWLGSLHLLHDWTDGCIALTNSEVEEVWHLVDLNTAVEIRP